MLHNNKNLIYLLCAGHSTWFRGYSMASSLIEFVFWEEDRGWRRCKEERLIHKHTVKDQMVSAVENIIMWWWSRVYRGFLLISWSGKVSLTYLYLEKLSWQEDSSQVQFGGKSYPGREGTKAKGFMWERTCDWQIDGRAEWLGPRRLGCKQRRLERWLEARSGRILCVMVGNLNLTLNVLGAIGGL